MGKLLVIIAAEVVFVTYYLVSDVLVTEKQRRHWILDEHENMVYNSASLEDCLTALTERGVDQVKALVGHTEVEIKILRKLSKREVKRWLR